MVKQFTKQVVTKPDFLQSTIARIKLYILMNKTKSYIFLGCFSFFVLAFVAWSLYEMNYEKEAHKLYATAITYGNNDENINYQNLLKLYTDVNTQYPRSLSALKSHYQKGSIFYHLNDFESAIVSYNEFLKGKKDYGELTTMAYIGLGYCYEAKKDFESALKAFEYASKTKLADRFESVNYRNIARIYELQNNKDKAVEFYKKALDKTLDNSVQQFIRMKIAWLN